MPRGMVGGCGGMVAGGSGVGGSVAWGIAGWPAPVAGALTGVDGPPVGEMRFAVTVSNSRSGSTRSIGNGKIIVELRSTAISVSVCR